MEKMQKAALRVVFNDYTTDYNHATFEYVKTVSTARCAA